MRTKLNFRLKAQIPPPPPPKKKVPPRFLISFFFFKGETWVNCVRCKRRRHLAVRFWLHLGGKIETWIHLGGKIKVYLYLVKHFISGIVRLLIFYRIFWILSQKILFSWTFSFHMRGSESQKYQKQTKGKEREKRITLIKCPSLILCSSSESEPASTLRMDISLQTLLNMITSLFH